MAAKGEQVDLKELGGDDEVKIKKKASIKTQKPSTLSNGTANANIEQSHATAGADATSVPASAGPSTPAVAPNTPLAGGAMPQALLSSGTYDSASKVLVTLANVFAQFKMKA